MFLMLGLNAIVTGLLIVLFLFVCLLLILTVLIQRPAGGGLSGAFGSGAGSGQTAFGTRTGDALTIATIIMFVLFLGFAIGLNYAAKPPKVAPGASVVPAGTTPPPGDPASGQPVGTGEQPASAGEPAAGTGEQPPAPAPVAPEAPQPASTGPETPQNPPPR